MQTANDITSNSFQLKASLFTLTVLYLQNSDPLAFNEQLVQLVKQTPKLFQHMPIVLDLSKLRPAEAVLNFNELTDCMRQHGLVLIGVRGCNAQQREAAAQVGLALLPNTKSDLPEPTASTSAARPTASLLPGYSTKVIHQPIRSGQQIYAKGSDLIVLASVSPGAELIADGHIHVYGTLRGRALAGVSGNQEARIFCQQLEAELVAIAGHYWISEDLQNNTLRKNVQIFLDKERLHVDKF